MLTTHEVASSIFGAYRLARFDRSGMQYLEDTPEGALRSFHAALLVLPGHVLMVLLRLWEQLSHISLMQFMLVEGIAYVISWTGYALLMFHVSRYLDRASRYPAFLCAYNWSAVVQMVFTLPAMVLIATGLLPEGLMLFVLIAVLIYQWFVTRTALDVNGSMAAALVLLDLVVSMFTNAVADQLLYPLLP